jgi:ribosome-binding factor A
LRARSETGSGRTVASEPTQRQLRVAECIRHLLAESLMRGEIHDARLEAASVTVAEVRVSRDLRYAKVFATELGRPLSLETRAALERAAPSLAGRLARQMHLKYAPRLHFVADALFDEAARIERLLAEERARLRRAPAGEDDEPRA